MVNLLLTDWGESLGEYLTLGDAIDEDQVHHAYIRIKDCLEKYSTLNTLDWDLSGDFFYGNIMGYLNQQVLICLWSLRIMSFLSREGTFHTLLGIVILARDVLILNHVNDPFEPFCQQYCILSAAWLAKISLCQAHFRRFFLQILLQPLWFLLFLSYAWLGQLVRQIVQRLQKLLSISCPVLLLHAHYCGVLVSARFNHFSLLWGRPWCLINWRRLGGILQLVMQCQRRLQKTGSLRR